MYDFELKKGLVRNIKEISELIIFDYFIEEVNSTNLVIHHMDYTCIGLVASSPKFKNGGIKWYCEYRNDDGDIVVVKSFKYVDNGVWIKHSWMDRNGGVGMFKVEFKPLNAIEIGKIKKGNRERAINFLMVSGDEMRAIANSFTLDRFSSEAELNYFKAIYIDIADSIDRLIDYFKYEIDLFILRGHKAFENKVNGLYDGTIDNKVVHDDLVKYVETQPSEQYPAIKRMKDSIMEQITINY